VVVVRHDVRPGDASAAASAVMPSLWKAEDAAMHLDFVFGPYVRRGVRGSVRVGWRRGWSESDRFHDGYFAWPDCREDYLSQAQRVCEGGGDVYIGFAPRVWDVEVAAGRRPRTSPALAHGLHALAFDLDEADRRAADAAERLQKAGAMLVTSGSTGHVHAYLVSPEPLTAKALDARAYAIKDALGLDRILDQSQVLRLGGSGNFKPQNAAGAPVRVVAEGDSSRYEQGLHDLVGEAGAKSTMVFGVDFGTGAGSTPGSVDWRDVSKGAKGGRPQGDGRTDIPYRHQVSYGWFCDLWERGYDDGEAVRLTLWTAAHGEPSERRRCIAVVDKFGTAEALQQEAMRVHGKRAAKSREAERRDRSGRRAAYGPVPACSCCSSAGGAT
jgi:hypothetical protein